MALDPKQIKDSYTFIAPQTKELIHKIYDHLIKEHPQAKSLFQQSDFNKQIQQLIQAFDFVVENLENTEKLFSYLEIKGSQLNAFGFESIHYDWIQASTLKSLNHFFQEKWTKELELQWTESLQIICTKMQDGAEMGLSQAA